MTGNTKFQRRYVLTMAALVMGATAAQAQHIPTGKNIAEKWCSSCHAIEPGGLTTATDGAPSFAAIARMSSTTRISLAVFLSMPHANMPNYTLTRQEIADISAYILSLKKRP